MSAAYTGAPPEGLAARLRAIGPPVAVAAGAGMVCVGVLLADPSSPGGPIPACPTKAYLGIDCPGCGGMRMLHSLLQGDIPAALHYNAVTVVAMLLFVWSTAVWAVGRWRGRFMPSWLHWRWTPLLVGVVLGLWFVVRNLPFAPFNALYV